MTEKVISALVEGGKASAGPPLGPALGPIGVNINDVIAEINEKTKDFAGITVPVKVIIDSVTKKFRIEVGSPPVSSLILLETGMQKGSGKPKEEKIGDITIDQAIKVMRAKTETLHAKTKRGALKEIVGSCLSLGVLIEGKDPKEIMREIEEGKYDDKLEGRVPLKEVTKEEIEKKKQIYEKQIAERKAAEEAPEEAQAEEEKKAKKKKKKAKGKKK